MTKDKLIQYLEGKKTIALSCIDAAYIFWTKAWVDVFNTYVGPWSLAITTPENNNVLDITIPDPKLLITKYENPALVNDVSKGLILLGIKDMIAGSFELIDEYCSEDNSDQGNIFKWFYWYHFTRLIRNAFSHDYTLKIGGKLPNQKLKFSNKRIEFNQTLDQEEFFDKFPPSYAFELWEMMRKSVDELN